MIIKQRILKRVFIIKYGSTYRMVKNFGSKKLWRIWQIEVNSPSFFTKFLKSTWAKVWSHNWAVSKRAMTAVVVLPTISIDNYRVFSSCDEDYIKVHFSRYFGTQPYGTLLLKGNKRISWKLSIFVFVSFCLQYL